MVFVIISILWETFSVHEKSMAFVHANGCKVGSQPKSLFIYISAKWTQLSKFVLFRRFFSFARTHSYIPHSVSFFLFHSLRSSCYLIPFGCLAGGFSVHCFCSMPLLLLCNLYSTSFSRWSIQQVPQKQKIYALSYRFEVKTKQDISICKIIWNVIVGVFAGFFFYLHCLFVCYFLSEYK